MKTRLCLAVFFTMLISISYSQETPGWLTWEEGNEIGIEDKKNILVFVRTDWCHWCKRMEEITYNNDKVSDRINKDFIPVMINPEDSIPVLHKGKEISTMELLSEISDGKFQGIPSTIIFNPKSGNSKMRGGFVKPEEFIKVLKKGTRIK